MYPRILILLFILALGLNLVHCKRHKKNKHHHHHQVHDTSKSHGGGGRVDQSTPIPHNYRTSQVVGQDQTHCDGVCGCFTATQDRQLANKRKRIKVEFAPSKKYCDSKCGCHNNKKLNLQKDSRKTSVGHRRTTTQRPIRFDSVSATLQKPKTNNIRGRTGETTSDGPRRTTTQRPIRFDSVSATLQKPKTNNNRGRPGETTSDGPRRTTTQRPIRFVSASRDSAARPIVEIPPKNSKIKEGLFKIGKQIALGGFETLMSMWTEKNPDENEKKEIRTTTSPTFTKASPSTEAHIVSTTPEAPTSTPSSVDMEVIQTEAPLSTDVIEETETTTLDPWNQEWFTTTSVPSTEIEDL